MAIYVFQSLVMTVAFYALLAVKIFALVDALTRRPDAFVAADKLTKKAWVLILALTVISSMLWTRPLGLFSILGTVAAFVYVLDVRPALASVTRRR